MTDCGKCGKQIDGVNFFYVDSYLPDSNGIPRFIRKNQCRECYERGKPNG